MRTLLRRARATGVPLPSLVKVLAIFATTVRLEDLHPLQSGMLRLKHPLERRPGLDRENSLTFWPRFTWEMLRKHAALARAIIPLVWAASRHRSEETYTDQALTPVRDDGDEAFELFTKTAGGKTALSHSRKIAHLTEQGRKMQALNSES
jgi:hypothetical protein